MTPNPQSLDHWQVNKRVHQRPLEHSLTVLLIAILLLLPLKPATDSASTSSQTSLTSDLSCYGYLRREHLIAPGKGWIIVEQHASIPVEGESCSDQRLHWTDDNGRTWRDITPPHMPTHSIGQVFFLNASYGWLLSSDALSEETNAKFYLFSTADAGKNWRTLLLTRPMFDMYDDYTFPGQILFSDPTHGWMMWHWGLMNSSLNYLLATTDGGRTWKRLPEPPGPGPFQFL